MSTLFYNGLPMYDNTSIDLIKLGHSVRFLRQGKGWTLNDLADKSGVSKAYISDLENGVAGKPNVQYVFSIATALGVTLDQLLNDAVPKPADRSRRKNAAQDLPPGLADLQAELKLSEDEVEMLAQVNFRGNRPKDKEGWRFLLEAIKMLGQRGAQR
jgi:transcriptional regulator with XRE-family HTH domain